MSIFAGGRFRESDVCKVFDPPRGLRGRCGAIRLRRGATDILAVGLYMPVKPNHSTGMRGWRRTFRTIFEWARSVIQSAPQRCIPLVGLDLNSALEPELRGRFPRCVGPCAGGGRVNEQGVAFCEMMRSESMTAVNTHFSAGATYFGVREFSRTRIDFLVAPSSLLVKVSAVRVLDGAGRSLQMISSRHRRDHYPMVALVDVPAPGSRPPAPGGGPRLDRDAISACLQWGQGRAAFLEQVESSLGDLAGAIAAAADEPAPDRHWRLLSETVARAAVDHFGQSQSRGELRALSDERRRLLVQRAEARRRQRYSDEADLALARASRALRVAARRSWSQRRADLLSGMWDSWRVRNMARLHWYVTQIAGTGVGTKRRRYDVLPSYRPSAEEWMEVICKAGAQGGMAGRVVDWAQFELTDRSQIAPPAAASDVVPYSCEDFDRVCSSIFRARRRRAAPPWSVPAEVWQIVLHPGRLTKPERAPRAGIGGSARVASAPRARRAFIMMHEQCRSTGLLPALAHRSFGWGLEKKRGGSTARSYRLVHLLCPYWSAYLGAVHQEAARWWRPSFVHGCVRHGRREDGMIVTRITALRMRMMGRSIVGTSHDMTNAFACTTYPVLARSTIPRLRPRDRQFYAQRRERACTTVVGSEGDAITFALGSGGMMGSRHAPDDFNAAFVPAVSQWNLAVNSYSSGMLVRCSVTQRLHDASVVVYVDDIFKWLEVPDHTASSAARICADSNSELNSVLDVGGWAQNVGKQEVVAALRTRVENRLFHTAGFIDGKVLNELKHLGGLLDAYGAAAKECSRRVAAAKQGWCDVLHFWASSAPWRVRRSLFIMKVQNALLSGCETYAFAASHLSRMMKCTTGMLRYMMKGDASWWDESAAQLRQLSSVAVWRRWKLAPPALELCVRRLRWYQSWSADMEQHGQVVAAMFGRYAADGSVSPLDSNGVVAEGAHFFAQRFASDMQALSGLDGGGDFLSLWGGDVRLLFVDGDVREEFLRLDVRALRSAFCARAWRPPTAADCDLDDEGACLTSESCEPGERWVCELSSETGVVCGASFASQRALLAHQRMTVGTAHGLRSLAGLAILSNECPICHTRFAPGLGATHHLESSLRAGRCLVDHTRSVYPLVRIGSIECRFCAESFEVEGEELYEAAWLRYQRHVLVHLPPLAAHTLHIPEPSSHVELDASVRDRIRRRWLARRAELARRQAPRLAERGAEHRQQEGEDRHDPGRRDDPGERGGHELAAAQGRGEEGRPPQEGQLRGPLPVGEVPVGAPPADQGPQRGRLRHLHLQGGVDDRRGDAQRRPALRSPGRGARPGASLRTSSYSCLARAPRRPPRGRSGGAEPGVFGAAPAGPPGRGARGPRRVGPDGPHLQGAAGGHAPLGAERRRSSARRRGESPRAGGVHPQGRQGAGRRP